MRTSKETKFMTAVFIAAGCLAFSSCGNDYDLSNLDKTIGINTDGLHLTTDNSTNEIILDDLLKLEGNDLITIDANGDYNFGKQPDPVSPVNIKINDISFSAPTYTSNAVDIPVPDDIRTAYSGQEFNVPSDAEYANISKWISAFDYATNVTAEVRELEYAVLDKDATVTITIPAGIKQVKNFKIKMPKFLELTPVDIQGGTFNDNSVTFSTLKNTSGAQKKLTLKFKINKFKMVAKQAGERDYAEFTAKNKPSKGSLKMHGDVLVEGTVQKIIVPAVGAKLEIGGSIDIGELHITKVKGTFDPDINLNDLGDVKITNIPDFLEDEEVVVDLDNPRLNVTLKSNLPLGGTVKAVITSDVYAEGIHLDSGDKIINIKASTDGTSQETKILLCRKKAGLDLTGYDQVIEDENLSKLVRKLHEGMKIKFDVTEARAEQVSKEVSTGNYTLTPSYEFSAPLAFGPEAVIVYRKTIDGWSDDLKHIKMSKDGYVDLTGTAVNSIPANLTVEVQVIGKPDAQGNLPRLDIPNAQGIKYFDVNLIKKTAYGTKSGSKESPIEVQLRDLTGDGLTKLDGIIVRLKADSNAEMRGVTLNKSSQTLHVKDITGTVHGIIIYDGN